MAFKRICVFPHGKMSVLVMFFAFIIFLMAIFVVNGCFFLRADIPLNLLSNNNDTNQNHNNNITTTATATETDNNNNIMMRTSSTLIGIFSYQVPQNEHYFQCQLYSVEETDDIFFDATFKAVRAFGTISLSILSIFFILLLTVSCIPFYPAAIQLLAIVSFLAGSFLCLTFLLFTSSNLCHEFSCELSIGAWIAIVVSIFAIINTVLIYKLPLSVTADNQDVITGGVLVPTLLIPGTTDVSITTLSDGTKKITKTTVNQDGSKTVEETVIITRHEEEEGEVVIEGESSISIVEEGGSSSSSAAYPIIPPPATTTTTTTIPLEIEDEEGS